MSLFCRTNNLLKSLVEFESELLGDFNGLEENASKICDGRTEAAKNN